MSNLRKQLINLNIFNDNEYFDKYVNLVSNNKSTKYIPYVTNSHHIIPKYYYISRNLEVDNSDSNKVNLEYKDHILAHYLLAKCSKNAEDVSRNALAIRYILNGKSLDEFDINEIDLEYYQSIYTASKEYVVKLTHTAEINEKISNKLTGRVSPNKGKLKPKVEKQSDKVIKNVKLSIIASQRVGEKNAFYGKKHSDETKARIGRKNSKPVAMIDYNTKEVIMKFESCTAATNFLYDSNITQSKGALKRISQVCVANDLKYSAYGFCWMFVNKV